MIVLVFLDSRACAGVRSACGNVERRFLFRFSVFSLSSTPSFDLNKQRINKLVRIVSILSDVPERGKGLINLLISSKLFFVELLMNFIADKKNYSLYNDRIHCFSRSFGRIIFLKVKVSENKKKK